MATIVLPPEVIERRSDERQVFELLNALRRALILLNTSTSAAAGGAPVIFASDGEDGSDGLPGLPGGDGIDGIPGTPGGPGPMGQWGQDGEDGADSLVPGPRGLPGADGRGFLGLQGDEGEEGAMGVPVPGPRGPIGYTGAVGFGLPGDDGEEGWPGRPGTAGMNGTNGTNGIQGPPGSDGEDSEMPFQPSPVVGTANVLLETSGPAYLAAASIPDSSPDVTVLTRPAGTKTIVGSALKTLLSGNSRFMLPFAINFATLATTQQGAIYIPSGGSFTSVVANEIGNEYLLGAMSTATLRINILNNASYVSGAWTAQIWKNGSPVTGALFTKGLGVTGKDSVGPISLGTAASTDSYGLVYNGSAITGVAGQVTFFLTAEFAP